MAWRAARQPPLPEAPLHLPAWLGPSSAVPEKIGTPCTQPPQPWVPEDRDFHSNLDATSVLRSWMNYDHKPWEKASEDHSCDWQGASWAREVI